MGCWRAERQRPIVIGDKKGIFAQMNRNENQEMFNYKNTTVFTEF
jgi:hypothetical protein